MTTVPSRTLSPTLLLYSFVVITQFVYGFYVGQKMELLGGYELLHWATQLWILGWWLRADSRKRGVAWVYDMGLFLSIAWPFIMPYYLVKTRRAKGLFIILAFVGTYIGAAIIGIVVSVTIATFRA